MDITGPESKKNSLLDANKKYPSVVAMKKIWMYRQAKGAGKMPRFPGLKTLSKYKPKVQLFSQKWSPGDISSVEETPHVELRGNALAQSNSLHVPQPSKTVPSVPEVFHTPEVENGN